MFMLKDNGLAVL